MDEFFMCHACGFAAREFHLTSRLHHATISIPTFADFSDHHSGKWGPCPSFSDLPMPARSVSPYWRLWGYWPASGRMLWGFTCQSLGSGWRGNHLYKIDAITVYIRFNYACCICLGFLLSWRSSTSYWWWKLCKWTCTDWSALWQPTTEEWNNGQLWSGVLLYYTGTSEQSWRAECGDVCDSYHDHTT